MTQETDRELLEWAAKAAGIKLANQMIESGWNPLTDDGDALRLADKLRINIIFSGSRHYIGLDHYPMDICCLGGIDAVRYGIVRTAANIGKAM